MASVKEVIKPGKKYTLSQWGYNESVHTVIPKKS